MTHHLKVLREAGMLRVRSEGTRCYNSLRLEELVGATEVFVNNSVAGVHPVGSVDGVGRWGPGPVLGSLRRLLG